MSDKSCWVCLQILNPLAESLDGPSAPVDSPGRTRGQFTLATIFLVTTFVAACLAICRLNACFGTGCLLLAVPALIRTFYLGAAESARGNRLSIRDKVLAFLASLGVILLAWMAGCIAMSIACTVTSPVAMVVAPAGDALVILWLILCVGTGLAIAVWVLWALRPQRP